jgi:autotransporter strand-loop-strand O-heptosyltransferase
MDKKKLLYIVPHLSTGGMPQYLLKQIQKFKDEFNIIVVEYNCVSMDFVVQRNKIKELCEVITIGEHKSDIVGIVRKEQPNIIHFQEIPETFVDKQYLNEIFDNGRNYNIIITTHSSYTEPKDLLYTADKFVLVSEWSRKKFAKYFTEIQCDIWEYPIDYWNGDKDEAKKVVGFDKEYKHILHVGLFTDGKNQGDIFELARLSEKENYKVKFHFVGNQASNFQFYWGPLMENKPDNCIIWGEQSDTEKFYKAADLFYFPSKWELNPLAVKEAISYRLPLFLKKLHTYENYYDKVATYISDNQQENLNHLINELKLEKVIYDNLIKRPNLLKPSFSVNFVDGPYLDVKSPTDDEYEVRFINKDTNQIEFNTKLKDGCWAKAGKKYFVNWKIEVYYGSTLVYEHDYDATGKRVYIALESKSLGDTLAWFPIAEEFRKQRNCEVVVSTFHNQFFKEQYPNLQFIEPGETAPNLYAMYRIGWYYEDDKSPKVDFARAPNDFKQHPLQKTASDILGLEYKEVRPLLKLNQEIKREKQVAIAIHGTAQSKYWNNEGGWQKVVHWLNMEGYRVVLLSREGDGYMGNKHPSGVSQLPAGPIDNVIEELQRSEVFIGIGSGLSWVSWATKTPTILISGFSEGFAETGLDTYRITAPEGKCSGCFNRHRLDPGDWNWCPDHKGTERQFECSKGIEYTGVIKMLKKVLD